jgi:cytochrome c oxidase subunit 1
MASTDLPLPALPEAHRDEPSGLVDYLTTVDHKKIGILYIFTSFSIFLAGGVLALLVRAELAEPGLQTMGLNTYNQVFTMHGTLMIFLFAAQVSTGLANYIVPLQIGAADVAFPRANAMSYWLYLFGALIVLSSFFVAGGPAAVAWTAYPPLSTNYLQGTGMDLWIIGLAVVGIAGILGAVNLVTTIFRLKVPGMTMFRMPLFTWGVLVNQLLILFAFPPLTAALALMFLDRNFGAVFFEAAAGGSQLLYQHIFWFFGHPEVYIIILPIFGVISEVIPVFSRKPLFGYRAMVFAFFGIATLSFGVWAHHMFATGAVYLPYFSLMSLLIAVPTGIKVFNWIGTMWRGSIRFSTAMLMALGFILVFVVGGITGVFLASPPIDFAVNDTYYVVAHFHYIMVGGLLYGMFEDHRPAAVGAAGPLALLDLPDRLQPDLLRAVPGGAGRDAAAHRRLPDRPLGPGQRRLHRRGVPHRGVGAAVPVELPEVGPPRPGGRRRPVGGQHPRMGDHLAAAPPQLPRAPPGPLRTPRLRPASPRARRRRRPHRPRDQGPGVRP